MRKRPVLIVSASTGTGHARAAEAVRQALIQSTEDRSVEHVDLLALAPSWVRAAYGGGYELMATRAPWLWNQVYQQTDGEGCDRARWSALAQKLLFREFEKLLRSSPWQVCLSTHFLPCQLAAGRPDLPPFALAITDFTLHRYWVQPGVQQYFVATEKLAATLRERAPRARVAATGIPISPAFSTPPSRREARVSLGLNPTRPVIAVMGGGLGLGIAEMVEATLAGAPEEVQIIAICGRNSQASTRLRALGSAAERLRVEAFVTDIERYIAAADAVVTKPGGLTASEALAVGRPLVLTRPIPGQETGNTRELVAAGAALAALSDREIRNLMGRLFADEGLLSGLASAARRLGRPDAAATVAAALPADWPLEVDRPLAANRSAAASRWGAAPRWGPGGAA